MNNPIKTTSDMPGKSKITDTFTSGERIRTLLNHRESDRVGIHDSFWIETVQNFRKQGAPSSQGMDEYFEFDIREIRMEEGLRFPHIIQEETDEYRIYRDEWGMLCKKWKHQETTPQLLDFIAKDRGEWSKVKPQLSIVKERINLPQSAPLYEKWRKNGKFIVLPCLDPFESTWRVIGPERHLMSLVQDPIWIQDIYRSFTDLVIAVFNHLWDSGIELDGMWLYGDIAYRNAPLISPKMYRQNVYPFHKEICDQIHRHNGKVIFHTDGNVNSLIASFIDAGIDCLQPMEVKAGMDVIELKEKYGKDMSFMGNIDVRFMQNNDLPGIENEIKNKFKVAMKDGGYIYHSDHSVPPDTRLDTYQKILEIVRKYGQYHS